jgi:ATP-dependent Clp protease, protease subunit
VKPKWYEFRAQATGAAEIVIYDEIGAFGIPAKAFIDELKRLGPVAELTVRINSPGGSVFDGVAIYNALERHGAAITVWIDGIAASIASMIAMAGDVIVMPENAMLVLHDPSGDGHGHGPGHARHRRCAGQDESRHGRSLPCQIGAG